MLIKSVFQAINHCHKNKIAHRDLKPENIMFSSKKSLKDIKIIDFGLSKLYDGKAQGSDSIVGTPYYVAPEVL
jgi:serine/threonine protein kinase